MQDVAFWLFSFISGLSSPFSPPLSSAIYTAGPRTRFKIRPHSADRFIIWETYHLHEYSSLPISPSDIIIDIGAHIGVFSIFAGRQATSGQVLAFEPHPENFRLLKDNISLNRLSNVRPFQIAISSKIGRRSLFINSQNSGGHSLYPTGHGQKIPVPTTTLNTIFSRLKLTRNFKKSPKNHPRIP